MYTDRTGDMSQQLRALSALFGIICSENFIYEYYIYVISCRRNIGTCDHWQEQGKPRMLNTNGLLFKEGCVLPDFCLSVWELR